MQQFSPKPKAGLCGSAEQAYLGFGQIVTRVIATFGARPLLIDVHLLLARSRLKLSHAVVALGECTGIFGRPAKLKIVWWIACGVVVAGSTLSSNILCTRIRCNILDTHVAVVAGSTHSTPDLSLEAVSHRIEALTTLLHGRFKMRSSQFPANILTILLHERLNKRSNRFPLAYSLSLGGLIRISSRSRLPREMIRS